MKIHMKLSPTCEDILIIRLIHCVESKFLNKSKANDVFPVPTEPTSRAGYFCLTVQSRRKLYRIVSAVGTSIL